MNTTKPVFIGFRVKHVWWDDQWRPAEAGHSAKVAEICSVSDCLSEAAPNWETRWDFNRLCCYNSEQEALGTIPAGAEAFIRTGHEVPYELFAYRMYEVEFGKTGSRPFDILAECEGDMQLPIEPSLISYSSIGYDLAGGPYMNMGGKRSSTLGFSCSPLSCNGLAAEYQVNRYCLIDDLNEAIRAGEDFGRTEPEPGPFYLYEVLRKRSDRWTPAT